MSTHREQFWSLRHYSFSLTLVKAVPLRMAEGAIRAVGAGAVINMYTSLFIPLTHTVQRGD